MNKSATSLFVFGVYLIGMGAGLVFVPNTLLSMVSLPQPQFSLPTPKYLISHGSSRPFCRRQFAIGLLPSKVRYSTHCDISWTVPLPTLPQLYGSQPS